MSVIFWLLIPMAIIGFAVLVSYLSYIDGEYWDEELDETMDDER